MTDPPDPLVVHLGTANHYLAIGAAGWAYLHQGDPRMVSFVQLYEEPSGRIVPRQLAVTDLRGVSGRELDRLPLGRIESAVNNPAVADDVRARLIDASDGEADLMMYIHRRFAPIYTAHGQSRRPRNKLKIPKGPKRPDSFYQQVASAYSEVALLSGHPAKELAAANGVPVTTVHRWIKEARRRGLLAPSRRSSNKETPP